MKSELERIRDQLKCSLNMGGLKGSAEWAVGELDRLLSGSLPVGVPDGYALVPINQFESVLSRNDWRTAANRAELRAMLAAAPTVKAEQVQCKSCGDFGSDCDECGAKAPSLPAAGSAVEEVEVVGYRFFHVDHGYIFRRTHIYEGNPSLEAHSLMTVAQHERIVAALSAQQSAPERVSVQRDLLADLISSDHDTRIQAERGLIALLNGGGV